LFSFEERAMIIAPDILGQVEHVPGGLLLSQACARLLTLAATAFITCPHPSAGSGSPGGARQESLRKGEAVRLGMENAKAQGKAVGHPSVGDRVDAELVARLRREWQR
jgi:hypothetical protein